VHREEEARVPKGGGSASVPKATGRKVLWELWWSLLYS
jgi:hypothetical protein